MPDFARNIISKLSQGPPSSWQTALILRFALLRHTAFPCFLPAIKATRPPGPCCFVGNTMSVRYGVCSRLPRENRSEISSRDLIVSNLDPSLHAKTLAALCATSSQHLTAALSRHTSTETVALSPLTSVRLIRALHIDSLSWF